MSGKQDALAELDDVGLVFEALSHAARRQILLVLQARGDTMGSKEIAERFSTTWATVSRHLQTLEAAGLVATVPSGDGRERRYVLVRERLAEVAGGWLARFDQPVGPSKDSS